MLHRNSTASCSVEKYSSKSLCDVELEEAMKEYAKMKCKELLLMTAEKVIGREGLTAYDILAVDLNEFIK